MIKLNKITRNYELYLILLPGIVYYVVFHYLPMYGVTLAFKDFRASLGILGSPWVGLRHFHRFFDSFQFWTLIRNTIGISVYQLLVGFPVPILLALMLNEVRHLRFKKVVQTVTYAPHFISTVVMVGMLVVFLSPSGGMINVLIKALGGRPINFLAESHLFKTIFVVSGVWQSAGFASIIYVSVLASIDPELHEAATIDGATRVQRIWHINVPGLTPTIVILLILNVGRIMSVGFEKVFLMQNPLNLVSSEVISTYVYKVGILGGEFSFSTAVGFFNSVINLILLVTVNRVAKTVSATSLW